MAEQRNDHARGAAVRADIVEVFVFRRGAGGSVEVLQLRRCEADSAAPGTWQPVMGHAEAGETAVAAMKRELREETGLEAASCLGLWQLEEVHPYFLASSNAVILSPRFAAEAPPRWEPAPGREHDAHRWIAVEQAEEAFLWPGQRAAIREIRRDILNPASPASALLRVE